MTEMKLSLLENLDIKNWYRFLLYIGGVILILSMFLEPKGITINQMRTFSINTIILSLSVWIIYDIFYKWIDVMSEWTVEHHTTELLLVKYAISIIGFLYWVSFILSIIPSS
jgi:hypothetical protein